MKNFANGGATQFVDSNVAYRQDADNGKETANTERSPLSNKDEQIKQDLQRNQIIDDYFTVTPPQREQNQPPRTPPHQIFSCGASSGAFIPFSNEGSNRQEFSDLDSTCSNFDHEKGSSQTIGQMQNDIENTYIQLSQENSQIVTEEIRKIIEKMEDIKYCLFDYNFSERNVMNPINKLSKSESAS
ncbi:hypothetical protein C1645_832039 [Glomus cerebriforme]|uniref:Uncharacterized protein n=1 Tax=Glomus cerebriforme TaxID=658196 RepID=A0A397SPM5_9GLOM|nr:hypothetical protein C1645_832039 [Glomus cerebriforme]